MLPYRQQKITPSQEVAARAREAEAPVATSQIASGRGPVDANVWPRSARRSKTYIRSFPPVPTSSRRAYTERSVDDPQTETLATLQQMLALLQGERQALAALDLERITNCTDNKLDLCAKIEAVEQDLDEECLGVLDAVRRLNEINRRLRNLIASNVQNRLGALSGSNAPYAALPRQG